METPQYCIKKTPEDAQREMEELTRREIIKLTEKIAQNPEILRHKFMGDSDDESSDSSSLSDDTSSVESSESESNALVIYKKEQEIDKLSEKNYYKSLEMNNLMIENQHLKDEINKLMVQNRNNTRIIDSFKKLFEYKISMKSNVLTIVEGASIKEITSSLVEIQSQFVTNKKLLSDLETETNEFEDVFKQYFTSEIKVLLDNITKLYDSNYESLNNHISKISEERAKEIVSDNKLAVGFSFALFIIAGFLANYFSKQ
jgi:hypothetical protein